MGLSGTRRDRTARDAQLHPNDSQPCLDGSDADGVRPVGVSIQPGFRSSCPRTMGIQFGDRCGRDGTPVTGPIACTVKINVPGSEMSCMCHDWVRPHEVMHWSRRRRHGAGQVCGCYNVPYDIHARVSGAQLRKRERERERERVSN